MNSLLLSCIMAVGDGNPQVAHAVRNGYRAYLLLDVDRKVHNMMRRIDSEVQSTLHCHPEIDRCRNRPL